MPNFGGVSPLFKNPTMQDDELDSFEPNESDFTEDVSVQDEPTLNRQEPQALKPTNSTLELLRKAYQDKYGGGETNRVEQATERSDNREFIASLMDAAAKVGNLRGKPTENTFVADAARSSQSDIANAKMLDDSEIKGLENQYKLEDLEFSRNEKQRKADVERAENDPTSEVSKSYRDLASKYFGGKTIPENASAAFIKKTLPDLQRIYLKQLELGNRKELKEEDRRFQEQEKQKDRDSRAAITNQVTAKKEQSAATKAADSASQKMGNREYDLFKRYMAEKSVQDYDKTRTTLNQMIGLTSSNNPANDQAIITLFNRALDPNSVVREAEFAITERGGGALNTVQAAMSKIAGTGRITPEIRANLLNAARVLKEEAKQGRDRKKKQYFDFARNAGLQPEKIFPTDDEGTNTQTEDEYEEWVPGGQK